MIESNKGTILDMLKQTTQVGLKMNRACKNIKSSDSTLRQKLEFDKKILISKEQKAIYGILMTMKSRGQNVQKTSFIDHLKVVKNTVKKDKNEKTKNYKKELEESEEDPEEEEISKDCELIASMPMRKRKMTMFE